MRTFGVFLVFVGLIWAVVAFSMSTTITTDSETIGSGEYSVYVPSQTVHNIGLMEERRNHLILSGLTVLAGVILVGFGSMARQGEPGGANLKPCPLCAELIQPAAMKCRFCGCDLPDSFRIQPQGNSTPSSDRLRKLIALIEHGNTSYETYAEAIGNVGGSIKPKGFLVDMHYVITLDGMQNRVDKFEDLRVWFLENVAPRARA